MGKVKIETYNSTLLDYANYSDTDILKKLFMNFRGLKRLSEKGDTVAISIYLDLEYCLENLSPIQRETIESILIDGLTYREFAEIKSICLAKINRTIKRALNNCRDILNEKEDIENT